MKKLFVVGNWKSNKTIWEAEEWIKQVLSIKYLVLSNLEIIICPPFTLLYPLRSLIINNQLPITLAAQDISPFPNGAYTGEVSGRMLRDLGVDYVLIGHCERRKYFKESEQLLENKVREALDFGLMPIFCVQGKTTPTPEGIKFLAYEPVFAIGTGSPDTPANANEVAQVLKQRVGKEAVVIYGGSVTPENVADFCRQDFIAGVLAGGASLDAGKFFEIVENAIKI